MNSKFLLKIASCLVLAAGMLAVSCSNDEIFHIDNSKTTEINPHAIPLEQALTSLHNFMNAPTESGTRAAKDNRRIGDVFAIKYYNNVLTRATHELNPDIDNLLYVANFENEQGFAVLAADDRINAEVLALADSGYLPQKKMKDALIEMTLEERPIFKNYPLTGPGFYTDEDYPDELQINPNTVNLYDEEEGDTLVGDFIFDEEDEIINGEIVNQGPGNIDLNDAPLFISQLALSYAIDNIETHFIDEGGGGYTGGGSSNRTETTVSDWTITKRILPILSAYKEWNQHEPFNNLFPWKKKRKKDSHRAYTGCFPLSIAKVMTHFSFPSNIRNEQGENIVNWEELKKSYKTEEGSRSAANLLFTISSNCQSKYFYNGTFTFPFRAVRALEGFKFTHVDKCHYKDSKVLDMLENGYPVIICGMPGIHITKSHAWNIDGYKRYERTTTTKIYSGNTLTNETQKTETRNMVHCDFGWSGKGNGYFISGIFDFKNNENMFDEYSTVSVNYNKHIRLITYRIP